MYPILCKPAKFKTSLGPLHSKKSNIKFDCDLEIEINSFSQNQSMEELNQIKSDIKHILSELILIAEYPKSVISISFEILQSDGSFFAHIINLACVALNLACIKTIDMFSASICVFIEFL